jgi:hypothetical protein
LRKEEESERDKNVKASEKIVENAIYCLKQSQSGKDFVRLNDKTNCFVQMIFQQKMTGCRVF